MRILNRPMFRYGGPIKEGVMHGMKNGGLSKQFNTGLVGDERYPKTDGREHHVGFLAPALWAGARMLARPFAKQVMKQVPKFTKVRWQKPGNIYSKGYPGGSGKGGWQNLGPSKETMKVSEWQPTKFGKWFQGDPMAGAVMSGKGFVGGAAKKGLQFGKYAFGTPSGLLFLGAPVTIAAGKYFLSDGKEITGDDLNKITQAPQEGVPGGGDPKMVGTGEWFAAEAQKKLAAQNKADRKAKISKYMDTMGYDKAKKSAIGDALIDASAIVQAGTEEGGSLKHADWSKMINQAIQTTSKRLDKPAQIREAIGLMMTKAEIQKDLTGEADALTKRKLEGQIAELDKKLNPSSGDIMLAMGDKSDKQGMLENIVRSNEGVENLKASFKDKKDTAYGDWKKKTENKNKSSLDFMEQIIKPSGAMVPGFYVFPERTVEVTDDLTIKWYH